MGFVDFYKSLFVGLGLQSPFIRFLFGTAVGFSGQLLLKPSISYHRDGSAKEFLTQTYFPWYVVSVLPGLIFGLFF